MPSESSVFFKPLHHLPAAIRGFTEKLIFNYESAKTLLIINDLKDITLVLNNANLMDS